MQRITIPFSARMGNRQRNNQKRNKKMAYRIKVTGGFNIVTDPNTAREYIAHYKAAGIFEGMRFLPWYSGDEVSQ
jgi:hypothetical protein